MNEYQRANEASSDAAEHEQSLQDEIAALKKRVEELQASLDKARAQVKVLAAAAGEVPVHDEEVETEAPATITEHQHKRIVKQLETNIRNLQGELSKLKNDYKESLEPLKKKLAVLKRDNETTLALQGTRQSLPLSLALSPSLCLP